MSTVTTKPCNPTNPQGVATATPETHQEAVLFTVERIKEGAGGFAACLAVNPAKGQWLRKAGPVYLIQEAGGYCYAIGEQWVMTHHRKAARVLRAIEAIELGNNGYADIGTDAGIAQAVEAAGLTVIRTSDLHGRPVYRGFTARAQAALRDQPTARSTYTAPSQALDLPDYEAAILARQQRHFEGA